MKQRTNPLTTILATAFSIVLLVTPSAHAYTLDQTQLNSFKNGLGWYNTLRDNTCAVSVSDTLPGSVPAAYKTIFEQAAAKYNINPAFLAAIFLTEHANTWPDPKGPWASSPVGASGPFQFMPGTWKTYGTGNIQNLEDSSNAAAKFLAALGATTSTKLGDETKPFVRNPPVFLYIAGSYNWGPGNMESKTTPNMTLSGSPLPSETKTYIKNVYSLVTSDFAKGTPGYGPDSVTDGTGGVAVQTAGNSAASNCSAVSSGSIIEAAVQLAWPEKGGHGKDKPDATQAYQQTLPTVHTELINDIWSDCGAFVSTVMRSTGADPTYMLRSTSAQLIYAKAHPEKFTVIDNVTDTGQFQPGDVVIYDGHTLIYIGDGKFNGYNAVDASWHSHVPTAQNVYIEAGGTSIVRVVGGVAA